MSLFKHATMALAVVYFTAPAAAAQLRATPANFDDVFDRARSGDTIVLAAGSYGATQLRDRTFTQPVTIDARSARFTGLLTLNAVRGLKIQGGTFAIPTGAPRYSRAITMYDGGNIHIAAPTVTGHRDTTGISVNSAANVQISDGAFSGLKLGIGFTNVDGGVIERNRFARMTSDGINIADSRYIRASFNHCSDTRIQAGAHPDCIQLWSILGRPPQRNIELSDNVAEGPTQGFVSFNGSAGGADRVVMTRNRLDTSYPQGIACYNCRDSRFTYNIVRTADSAQHRTSINIVGGRNNVIADNIVSGFDDDDDDNDDNDDGAPGGDTADEVESDIVPGGS